MSKGATHRTNARPTVGFEIPQAERIDKVRLVVEKVALREAPHSLSGVWGSTLRHVHYYVRAAIILGLVRESPYRLTRLGRELIRTPANSASEKAVLRRAILRARALADFWSYFEGIHQSDAALGRLIQAVSGLGSVTARRRVLTLRTWKAYAFGEQLLLPLPRQTDPPGLRHNPRTEASHSMADHATPVVEPTAAPILVIDGKCITTTAERMSTALSREAVDAIRTQAEGLVEDILLAYARDVAEGEVGGGGTARVRTPALRAQSAPTGLLYGRIQSGKTAAMILTAALAVDNGFRVVIVVTSDYVELVSQTKKRFDQALLDGPLVYSANRNAEGYEWNSDFTHIRRFLPDRGLLVIVPKNVNHQEALLEFLKRVDAPDYPALILDDEADQATPDTTTRARAAQNGSPPAFGSAIFRRIVQNDAPTELGDSLRETLKHNVYVAVTATPFALLLQNIDHPLRPKFTRLLEPGDGYAGGEAFFGNVPDDAPADDAVYGQPPVCIVSNRETQNIRAQPDAVPDGLAKAINYFLVAAAYTDHRGLRPADGYKFLCHTSQRTVEHSTLASLIRRCVEDTFSGLSTGTVPTDIRWAHAELGRSVDDLPRLEDLLRFVVDRGPRRKVLLVNAAGDKLECGPHYNFIVGGNILGRGLTLDHLLVTYYLRRAQRTQMDTMLQHARMFGYRRTLLPVMRVFLPVGLAARFQQIHESEVALRGLFALAPDSAAVPVELPPRLGATRPSVIDANSLGTYRPGQQVHPFEPAMSPATVGRSSEAIRSKVSRLGVSRERENEFVDVPLAAVIDLIDDFRVTDDDSDWDPDAIKAVLSAIGSRYANRASMFVRQTNPTREVLTSGTITGAEQKLAKARGCPVLFAAYAGPRAVAQFGTEFWVPTIVFPTDMALQVFSTS